MKESIERKIVEALVKDLALEDIEAAAQQVRILHIEMVQTMSSFVRVCNVLQNIKEEYGEEVYQIALNALGLKVEQIEYVNEKMTMINQIPQVTYKQNLQQIAWSTIKQIKILGGNNGDN